ncbi:hypothetical protein JNW90_28245, partial [Micromonospora sp. STR1s_5]|nr:hypothetical protein [Micromonospora sp. STR1s_5]
MDDLRLRYWIGGLAVATAATLVVKDPYVASIVNVGGLGSVLGAILGGLFVAVIETLGGFYFDPSSA